MVYVNQSILAKEEHPSKQRGGFLLLLFSFSFIESRVPMW